MGMAESQRARVLVVDKDDETRGDISAALVAAGYEVWAEPDGRALEDVFARFGPHLVILEVRYSAGPDGYAIARRLRRARDVPIVFVSSETSAEARLAGFREGGADDYVCKPLPLPELVARVTAILRRSRQRSFGNVEVGDLRMTEEAAPLVSVAGKPVRLSPTEYEVLSVLVRHRGRVVPKPQLIREVWGSEALNAELVNLLAVHVSGLRRKLGSAGEALIQTVPRRGYMLVS